MNAPEPFLLGYSARAIQQYLAYLTERDIHHVQLRVETGGVTWAERGDLMLAEFADMVQIEGCKVLSVGSNSGGDMVALLRAGAAHVTGLDVMPELVSLTSALLILGGVAPHRWTMLCGDIERYDAREQFDVIYNAGVLYHLENPMLALRACFRALKPGGWLALETQIVQPHHGSGHHSGDLIFWPLFEPQYVTRGNNWPTWFIPAHDVLAKMLTCVGFIELQRKENTQVAKSAWVAQRPL